MSLEEQDEMPDLRSRRLAYTMAIADTDAAQAVAEQPSALFEVRMRRRGAYHDCRDAELAAGRAYMALLAEVDPACSSCGCTQMNACADEDGDTCGWASFDPVPLCTFCARQQQHTERGRSADAR